MNRFILLVIWCTAYFAQGEKCEELMTCVKCLDYSGCSYYILNEGGTCGSKTKFLHKYISQVRSISSCDKGKTLKQNYYLFEIGLMD